MQIDENNKEIFDETRYNDEQLKLIVSQIEKMEIVYRLQNSKVGSNEFIPRYHWIIKQSFNF